MSTMIYMPGGLLVSRMSGYHITSTIKPTIVGTVIVHRAYMTIVCVKALSMLSIPSTSSRFVVPGPRSNNQYFFKL